ncbi:hypothetical protein MBTS_03360 [Methylobacterium bullatum]|nr:hypothetical protein [Methylobacterium bullatum]
MPAMSALGGDATPGQGCRLADSRQPESHGSLDALVPRPTNGCAEKCIAIVRMLMSATIRECQPMDKLG